MSLTIKNMVTPKAEAKHELLFNKPASDSQARLLLKCFCYSEVFWCDQFHSNYCNEFAHTLLCCSSPT